MASEENKSRIETELRVLDGGMEFTAAYLAIQYLFLHVRESLPSITEQTVSALFSVLETVRHQSRRQAFFLYKEAADALIHIAIRTCHPFSGPVVFKLQEILMNGSGQRHRAVSEALGRLPLKISGPTFKQPISRRPYALSFDAFTAIHGIPDDGTDFHWQGRTLICPVNARQMVCIKFARSRRDIEDLAREIEWLAYLNSRPPCSDPDFMIPFPVDVNGSHVFCFSRVPDLIRQKEQIHPDHLAVAFITGPTYFHYANEPCYFTEKTQDLKTVFRHNAFLLGRLTAMGIIHTAIIPLFHNRVQQLRRRDRGVYLWEHGGRLDQWLASCRYPNFARSGLRDFEHLSILKDTMGLRHCIGEHILGLILVMGSFFRNKAPDRTGWDEKGNPLDTRYLFDRDLFRDLLVEAVQSYYYGLTGLKRYDLYRFCIPDLVDRLIDQMGMDHHMEEVLRVQDQTAMNDEEFQKFLSSRGYRSDHIRSIRRGETDLVLHTGPHLGGFNQPISVPELIDFLFRLSSLCISDRFVTENGLKAHFN